MDHPSNPVPTATSDLQRWEFGIMESSATKLTRAQLPPMPCTTLPVPLHTSHVSPPLVPEPWQAGHKSSPVPGVPGSASSPGLRGGCCAMMCSSERRRLCGVNAASASSVPSIRSGFLRNEHNFLQVPGSAAACRGRTNPDIDALRQRESVRYSPRAPSRLAPVGSTWPLPTRYVICRRTETPRKRVSLILLFESGSP
jgi:hypothetical protein